MTTRRARVAQEARPEQPSKLRVAAFVLVALAILGGGIYMAGSAFLGQRGGTAVAGAISMRVSMDGFDPGTIQAKPGQTVTLDWWNQDAAMHLTGGVHTMVSDTLGIRFELRAQSRETVTIVAPMTPGDYDFWCDSCCGGKDNPKMHGKLHVSV
jgi:cytochrome c oxidase subunit 2